MHVGPRPSVPGRRTLVRSRAGLRHPYGSEVRYDVDPEPADLRAAIGQSGRPDPRSLPDARECLGTSGLATTHPTGGRMSWARFARRNRKGDNETLTWRRVGMLADLVGDRMVAQVDGRSILLIRRGRDLVAVENRCPHMGRSLSDAAILGDVLVCAGHGQRWRLGSGGPVARTARQQGLLRRFPAVIEGDRLYVAVPNAGAPREGRY